MYLFKSRYVSGVHDWLLVEFVQRIDPRLPSRRYIATSQYEITMLTKLIFLLFDSFLLFFIHVYFIRDEILESLAKSAHTRPRVTGKAERLAQPCRDRTWPVSACIRAPFLHAVHINSDFTQPCEYEYKM
jgi:hypothetical protein